MLKIKVTPKIEQCMNALAFELDFVHNILYDVMIAPILDCQVVFNESGMQERIADVRKFLEAGTKSEISYELAYLTTCCLAFFVTESGQDIDGYDADDKLNILNLMFHIAQASRVYTGFEENLYLKNISLPEQSVEIGNCLFEQEEYLKNEFFLSGVCDPMDNSIGPFSYLPKYGLFHSDVCYPVLTVKHNNGDADYMGVTPLEVELMQSAIEQAYGNVLMLGCGFGYFAYMAGLKDNVTSITIVESSADVIAFFEKYILPQFPCKEKIKVVSADALDYLKNLDDGVYDFCFSDIWTDVFVVSSYIDFLIICKKFQKMSVVIYQNEQLLRNVSMSLALYFQLRMSFEETEDIPREWHVFDKLFDNVVIETDTQLLHYLQLDVITQMIADCQLS